MIGEGVILLPLSTFDFGESFRHRNIGSLIKVIENDLKNLITQKVNL